MHANLRAIGIVALLALTIAACGRPGRAYDPPPALRQSRQVAPVYPQATFAVLSDPHFYDPQLGRNGAALQRYLDDDRKLLLQSGELLDAAIAGIAASPAAFVLVCGDLTKDGERVNHEIAARKLKRLTAAGKPVYVVPGNHDINNGEALRYEGDCTAPVANVSDADFAAIYRDLGYAAALARDHDSLSYLVEPVPGLWLLALDSCKWKNNQPGRHAAIGGAYSDATWHWMETLLAQARQQGKAVIAMQHHGVLEHYPHNRKFYGRYLVDDDRAAAAMLSAHGVRLVFTGHFHAQDITAGRFADPPRVIYDIETGATVTAPCPYRLVTIGSDRKARISSRFIEAIPSHPENFGPFAAGFVYQGTIKLVDSTLAGYGVPAADRKLLSPQISRAYVTHLRGDEHKPEVVVDTTGLGLWTRFVLFMQQDLIAGWYTDLPPADNDAVIDLR